MPLLSDNQPASENQPVSNRLIVLLTDRVSESSFVGFARRLGQRAAAMGYRLVIGSTELMTTFRDMDPVAYIVVPGQTADLDLLIGEGKPVYIIGADDFKGGYDATERLIGKGHKDIVFLTSRGRELAGRKDLLRSDERRRGYEAAMVGSALVPNVVRLPPGASASQISGEISSLLEEQGKVDALLIADQDLVLAGADILRRHRKRLAVVAFDDDGNLSRLAPFVSAVVQVLDEMAEYVLQRIDRGAGGIGDGPAGGVSEMKTKPIPSLVSSIVQ